MRGELYLLAVLEWVPMVVVWKGRGRERGVVPAYLSLSVCVCVCVCVSCRLWSVCVVAGLWVSCCHNVLEADFSTAVGH